MTTPLAARPTPTAPPASAKAGDPRWTRPALWALLTVTALTYLWDLGASGNANSYYAAAVQAGTQSWKALLFGSVDAGNSITVDKPPAALWVMGLSGRLFAFSSWSMLAPQALMGVASVALLYAAVRRWADPKVALAAAAVLAFTPAAVLMFRFNNPDALLVLLMVAAAYCCVRAVDAAATRAGTWWLVAAGTLIGFGFLTKMLQVMLVVPAMTLMYLLVADTRLRRRIGQLLAAGAAIVVSAGWYIALVELWPADSRPYIGGSTNNSLLELALGYNGLSRLTGGESGGPGGADRPSGMPEGMRGMGGTEGMGGGGMGGFGGESGITRMFNSDFGGNISWLLPPALVALVAGLWLTRRAPRTDRTRAALILWGGWLLVTGLVFSSMSGIVHPYYTVAMAPGLAGSLAVGGATLWRARAHWVARLTLAVTIAGTAAWSWVLLTRTPDFLPWLRWVVAGAGAVATLAALSPLRAWPRLLAVPAVAVALLAGVGGSSAYAVETALTAHHGSVVSAGPSSASQLGPGGGGAGDRHESAHSPIGPGGESASSNAELVALLRRAGDNRWAAATIGAQSASELELASGTSVMAIGGFSGGDSSPTLEQFQAWVARGEARYFIASGGGPGDGNGPGGGGPGGGSGTGSQIQTWVAEHYTATTIGGQTVYDLTARAR
jgi:4-amino-4-deoxy-L-arabinose transferase-like glycosyltransferase